MQAMTVFCYNNEFRAVNRLGYCYGPLLYVYVCVCVFRAFDIGIPRGDMQHQSWNVCL